MTASTLQLSHTCSH